MKDQYFGDINDYWKYGLLRVLANQSSFRTGVCWMLTPDDETRDGERRRYFDRPNEYERFDAPLFNKLCDWELANGRRSVGLFAQARLLKHACYWDRRVPRLVSQREQWLEEMCDRFAGTDLVFFDPDNGLEVKSTPWQRTASPKHLYWRELERVFQRGHSLLVFQHFGRVRRDEFVAHLKRELKRRTGCPSALALHTSHVVFLLASQKGHQTRLAQAVREVKNKWRGEIWLQ
jgi:hypothetical protein